MGRPGSFWRVVVWSTGEGNRSGEWTRRGGHRRSCQVGRVYRSWGWRRSRSGRWLDPTRWTRHSDSPRGELLGQRGGSRSVSSRAVVRTWDDPSSSQGRGAAGRHGPRLLLPRGEDHYEARRRVSGRRRRVLAGLGKGLLAIEDALQRHPIPQCRRGWGHLRPGSSSARTGGIGGFPCAGLRGLQACGVRHDR